MWRRKVMNEDILPACERLRREKAQFMEWQAASSNVDRLRRFCVGHRYTEAQRCAPGATLHLPFTRWRLSTTLTSPRGTKC